MRISHNTLASLASRATESLNSPDAPYILYGGSLAGAQTAFSVKEYGGKELWGGIASSGTTFAKLEYPEW